MKSSKAFTLLEIIIVIAVFGTGILTVLYGMGQTLGTQDRAETQISSSFFAREGIELLFNLRDSNLRKELPWNCIFQAREGNTVLPEDENPFCDGKFASGTVVLLSMEEDAYVRVIKLDAFPEDFEERFEKAQIFYQTWEDSAWNVYFRYTHDGEEGETTRYARYLLIKPVYEDGVALREDKILKVESRVLFRKWALTGETVMESFIGSY